MPKNMTIRHRLTTYKTLKDESNRHRAWTKMYKSVATDEI